MATEKPTVKKAAGGVVARKEKGKTQVLVIHRPKYDDWTLPKGGIEEGETPRAAALREVQEETGYTCLVRAKIESNAYKVGDKRKRVQYWLMTPKSGEFAKNKEVDEVRWLTPGEARKLLTHKADQLVMADAVLEFEDFIAARRAKRKARK